MRGLLTCALLLPAALALADASVGPAKTGEKIRPFRPPPPPPRYCKLMFAPDPGDHALEKLDEALRRKVKPHLDRFVRAQEQVLVVRNKTALVVLAFDEKKPGARLMSLDLAGSKVRWTQEITTFPVQDGWPATPHKVRIDAAWRQGAELVALTNYDEQGCFEILVDATTGTPEAPQRRFHP
jgi:hypothetical protein